MRVIRNIAEWQAYRRTLTDNNLTVGFVPTMGNLHRGHASLLQRSKKENDLTVLSLFINPTQFSSTQDFTLYPRTEVDDLQIAEQCGVDVVLMPSREDIYPDDYRYQINENQRSLVMEGEKRPGHFTGMLTIVMKLLNLVRPTRAYFGEKDYQQYELIRGMCQAFFMEIEICSCLTVREDSGLAFSSRNNRLSAAEKERAAEFAAMLTLPCSAKEVENALITAGFEVDYVIDEADRRFAAVIINDVRLIDNRALVMRNHTLES